MRTLVVIATLAGLAALAGLATLVALGLAIAPPAYAGEAADTGEAPATPSKPTLDVVLTLAGGRTLECTVLEGTKDGTIKVKSPYGEQTFKRNEWVEARPKTPPAEFAIAKGLYNKRQFGKASDKYQEIYDTYEHLYVLGADALDGKGQALMQLDKYKSALAVYERLFQDYSGADITYLRRYFYAVCLSQVGGEKNFDEAVTQLEGVVAVTDDVITVRSLYQLGLIHNRNKKRLLALRAFMQVFILYRSYQGDNQQEIQALVERARKNAIACCNALGKSSNTSIKRRVGKIKSALEHAGR